MIIVRLIGGLGNQLFQYAVSRRLSYIHDVPLKIDISGFCTYKLHKYSLHPFNIIENFASKDDLNLIKKPSLKKINPIKKNLETIFNKNKPIIYIKEQSLQFDPNILNLQDNVYLDGYWQCENYFKDINFIIQNEFKVRNPPDPINMKILSDILDCESVSIHIRRGDYVNDPRTNKIHGICDLNYYMKAIEIINQKIDNPHYYVFSDDPEWAKKNIVIDKPIIFLSHNGPSKNFEDLRLMSSCKNHIIANSTFSWWGSYLSNNSEKIIIAPKNWFNSKDINSKDISLKSWHSI